MAKTTTPSTSRTPAMDAPSTRRTRAIDPQMRPLRWAGKAHSRLGRLFIALRAELVDHVGGKPTATQRALIDRIAMLQTHLVVLPRHKNPEQGFLKAGVYASPRACALGYRSH